jgi:hypothetical protein
MRSVGSRGGVLVGVGFRVETCTWTNWAKKSKVGRIQAGIYVWILVSARISIRF